jgi:hypothetical protein
LASRQEDIKEVDELLSVIKKTSEDQKTKQQQDIDTHL